MAMTGQRQKSKEKSPTAQSTSSSLSSAEDERKDHGRKMSCKTKLCLMVLTVVVIVMGVSKMQQDSRAGSSMNSLRTTAQKEQEDTGEVSAVASRSMTEDSSSTSTSTTSSSTQSTSTSTNTCQWRPEPLQGHCDGTKSTDESKLYTTAQACQTACCESPTCVTFQFRAKEGCLWGADTRVGNEKDGVTAWCEPRPPAVWQGQWIKTKQEGVEIDGGCSDDGWNPQELSGQCFGLGGKQDTGGANTARACRDACCNNPTCKLWQFRRDAGCFYNNHGFNCREAADPLEFEPFIGARKVQPTRSYTPHAYTADYADMAAEMEQKMQ
ncbi:expressed unknown protein [Seminavis robusta]|uniref:Apple domain-containing protein n=1 Tax=Seminavis robusta TaxID=568900 RepID=A0A9N8HWI7_9STRA|nr:expressed unknown protein [Seminavis robusta]|eukprot:Sro2190_g318300.1 n/a (325) ;mRNA; f:1544-2518